MESKLEEQTCEETHRVYAECEAPSCWLDFEIARRSLFTNANSVQISEKKFRNLKHFWSLMHLILGNEWFLKIEQGHILDSIFKDIAI